jgi:predicted phosphoribosyltransferase
MTRFHNRQHAGRYLARSLGKFADRADTIVLALPRGGVPVAHEVATALNLPLDVIIVRKLGVPGHEEAAFGAIAAGGVLSLSTGVVSSLDLSPGVVNQVVNEETHELQRREKAYRGNRPPLKLHGATVILVDDGLATGSTMRAAIEAVRKMGAATIIAAAPVGAPDTCQYLARFADQIVCPAQPDDLNAISLWYDDFTQTTDDEVRSILAEGKSHLWSAIPSAP